VITVTAIALFPPAPKLTTFFLKIDDLFSYRLVTTPTLSAIQHRPLLSVNSAPKDLIPEDHFQITAQNIAMPKYSFKDRRVCYIELVSDLSAELSYS